MLGIRGTLEMVPLHAKDAIEICSCHHSTVEQYMCIRAYMGTHTDPYVVNTMAAGQAMQAQ